MPSLSLVLSACALTLAYVVYKRFTRISLSHVKGPESSSFLYGETSPAVPRSITHLYDIEL